MQVYRLWWTGNLDRLIGSVRQQFTYGPGDDRATGYLYGDGQAWPPVLALLAALRDTLGVDFEYAAFQAYLNGSGCDWHDDATWATQAILSLGVTRTFGVRAKGGEPEWIQVNDGDLVYMPAGLADTHEHCVPTEDVPGERISLVFRTRS